MVTHQLSDSRAYSSTNRKPRRHNRKPDGRQFIGGRIAAGGILSDNRPMVHPNRQICCLLRAYCNIRHLPGQPEQTLTSGGDSMVHKKKLIEVALPLDAINKASARQKSR
jgi:hypothetical protein